MTVSPLSTTGVSAKLATPCVFASAPTEIQQRVRRVCLGGAAVGVLALAGCGGEQSTLAPDSRASHSIATLWWVMLVGSAVVVGVVTLLVLISLLKRRGRLDRVDRRDNGHTFVLVSGALVPTVVLIALFVYILTTLS